MGALWKPKPIRWADKASHAYRGRKGCEPMFAPAGTIYMYQIRQWDALNISALGAGCAVLIKAAVTDDTSEPDRRLSGQGLLCRAMGLKTAEWNGKFPDEYPGKSVGKHLRKQLGFTNSTEPVTRVRVTPRLGVTADKDFPYRFVEEKYSAFATLPRIKAEWRHKKLTGLFSSAGQAVHFAACKGSNLSTTQTPGSAIA